MRPHAAGAAARTAPARAHAGAVARAGSRGGPGAGSGAGMAAASISSRSARLACCGTTPLPMIFSWRVRGMPGTPVTSPGARPIIHSANSADSQGRPPGPGWAGGGAGQPRTRSQRRIAGPYSVHQASGPGRVAGGGVDAGPALVAVAGPAAAPAVPAGRACRCQGWAAAGPRPAWRHGSEAGGDDVDQAGLPLGPGRAGAAECRPCRSGAVSPATGVGSSRDEGGLSPGCPGEPGAGRGLPGEDEQAVAAVAGSGVGRA